jgi:predicted nicotinamide N-methyase
MPATPDTDAEALVRQYTRIQRLALVPELRLYLADALVPLWQATEWRAAAPQPPPFWAFAWPGSQALARYLFDAPERVRDRRVLDFGSGSGLAAIAAVKTGAREVIACDVDPLAAVAQRLNAFLNGVSLTILTGDGVDLDLDVEVILAGDVCYEREPAERTLAWLRDKARATDVWIADPGRHYAPSDGLDLLASYEVPVLRELESVDTKRTRLWRLRPLAPSPRDA